MSKHVFAWVRYGSTLKLARPNAVNDWALREGGNADSLAYQLHPFTVLSAPGQNNLAATTVYEGMTRAAATAPFSLVEPFFTSRDWNGLAAYCRSQLQ